MSSRGINRRPSPSVARVKLICRLREGHRRWKAAVTILDISCKNLLEPRGLVASRCLLLRPSRPVIFEVLNLCRACHFSWWCGTAVLACPQSHGSSQI